MMVFLFIFISFYCLYLYYIYAVIAEICRNRALNFHNRHRNGVKLILCIGFWGIAKRPTPRYKSQPTPSCVSIDLYHPWAFNFGEISETKNQTVNASLCCYMQFPIRP